MTAFNTKEALLQIRAEPSTLANFIEQYGARTVVPQIVGQWIQDHIIREKEQGTMPGAWIDAIVDEKTLNTLRQERNWPLMASLLNEAQKMEFNPAKKEQWQAALGDVAIHPDIKSAFDFGLMDAIGQSLAYQNTYVEEQGTLRLDTPTP